MSLVVIGVVAMMVKIATALEPFTNFGEGPCINAPQVPYDRAFMDTLSYVNGGSRLNRYSTASAMPNYATMREDEFFYDGCFSRNTNTTHVTEDSVGKIFGFGRLLHTYRFVVRPGIYIEGVPLDPSLAGITLVDRVTQTDHKTFAVLSSCWTGINLRGWFLMTRDGYLDAETKKIVEDHVESLGFKRENFVFLRYDSCQFGLGNPALESQRKGGASDNAS